MDVPRCPRRTEALAAVIVLVATLLASAPAVAARSRPVALVYRGPAACSGCAEAVAALVRHSSRRFVVHYIGPHESRRLTRSTLHGAALYAQPGGDGSVGHVLRSLGSRGATAIRSYVADGGHYVGFCMGAYLAGSEPGLGLLSPGNTGEYSRTRGADVRGDREAVIRVRWGHTTRRMYVQDAPYITGGGGRREDVLARYTNGRAAVLVRPYHHGTVGVVGPHPEADRSWYTARLWRADHDGIDRRYGLRVVEATLTD